MSLSPRGNSGIKPVTDRSRSKHKIRYAYSHRSSKEMHKESRIIADEKSAIPRDWRPSTHTYTLWSVQAFCMRNETEPYLCVSPSATVFMTSVTDVTTFSVTPRILTTPEACSELRICDEDISFPGGGPLEYRSSLEVCTKATHRIVQSPGSADFGSLDINLRRRGEEDAECQSVSTHT